jgi:acetyl-CoA carboxylase biotin carboxyl carrier protein
MNRATGKPRAAAVAKRTAPPTKIGAQKGTRTSMSDKKPSTVDPETVRELAGILRDTGLTEIEIEHGDMKLRLSRAAIAAAAPVAVAIPAQAPAPVPVAYAQAAAPPAPAVAPAPAADGGKGRVASPMVGTAYLASAPEAPPFVKVGDQVREGQTLMIIEAMKTMNQIPAPFAGKVLDIVVADAQPVEFGETLVILG